MSVRDLGVCQMCGKRATRTGTLWKDEDEAWARIELCKPCWRARRPEKAPAMPTKKPPLFRILARGAEHYPELDELLFYQLAPLHSRILRVKDAWLLYEGEEDEASILFHETECLETMLLFAHRVIEWKRLGQAWEWCQEVLAYLSATHGYKCRLPDHLPLL